MEALYSACRRLITDTDAPTIGAGTPPPQSWANTTWLAPPNRTDDRSMVWRGDSPLASPSTPKTRPNGTTPSWRGSSWRTPVQNSVRRLGTVMVCLYLRSTVKQYEMGQIAYHGLHALYRLVRCIACASITCLLRVFPSHRGGSGIV